MELGFPLNVYHILLLVFLADGERELFPHVEKNFFPETQLPYTLFMEPEMEPPRMFMASLMQAKSALSSPNKTFHSTFYTLSFPRAKPDVPRSQLPPPPPSSVERTGGFIQLPGFLFFASLLLERPLVGWMFLRRQSLILLFYGTLRDWYLVTSIYPG